MSITDPDWDAKVALSYQRDEDLPRLANTPGDQARDELLAIKHGAFTYDALLTRAEALMTESAALFAASSLPDAVDKEAAIAALVAMREALYG